ncbi:MAG: D-2-hydroxyacid dehydrogenase [Halobacteriovoraceae bacterium]|nr:D-2-hydroxyacid dehydrogenase [Halobacteriovoraceae bacterium]
MQEIVFLDAKTLGSDLDFSELKSIGNYFSYETTEKDEILARAENADVLIVNKVKLTQEILSKLPKVKLICVAATGTDNIDITYAKKNNIRVENVSGYSTDSVVQHTFSMLFYLLGQTRYYDEYTKGNQWEKSDIFTHFKPYSDLANKKWGIIGLGEIGKQVAIIAKNFGCDVQYFSTSGKNNNDQFKQVNLDDLLKTSDIISIHAPLNRNTYNLLNKNNLRLLKNDSVLLNLGRGGIINEQDLFNVLSAHSFRVGLDVLEQEPPVPDSSYQKLVKLPNVLITPHIAWASKEARQKLLNQIVDNINSSL